jgi:DeoR family deoxyribose operon repressor
MIERKKSRLRRLAGALYGRGALHLNEAAALLDVSPMTVRRDIAAAPDHFIYLGGYIVAACAQTIALAAACLSRSRSSR